MLLPVLRKSRTTLRNTVRVKTPLVFLDTETCGLNLSDPIWEVAAVRAGVDGTKSIHQFYVEHDVSAADNLPEKFKKDHDDRYDPSTALTLKESAEEIERIFSRGVDGNRPHLVGANPAFDACRIQIQFGVSPWHYHIIDVEDLALGYLTSKGQQPPIPWSSDDLAERLNIDVSKYQRHKALDDTMWAMEIFEVISSHRSRG